MATRGSAYAVGNTPPRVVWTVVRGDTASFRAYVTDDAKQPLDLSVWSINMDIKRPTYNITTQSIGTITDNASLILSLTPVQDPDDLAGEFTVSLTADQSELLQTGDIFDIELSTAQDALVWTVAQGHMVILEDVTA